MERRLSKRDALTKEVWFSSDDSEKERFGLVFNASETGISMISMTSITQGQILKIRGFYMNQIVRAEVIWAKRLDESYHYRAGLKILK